MLTMNHLPALSPAQREQFKKDAAEIDKSLGLDNNDTHKDSAGYEAVEQQAQANDNQVQQYQQQPVMDQESEESTQKYNWTMLREAKEAAEREKIRAERERDELLQRIRESEYVKLQQQMQQMQQQMPREDQEGESEPQLALEPDALAEGKHVSQLHKEIRQMKSQLKQYQKQTQQTLMESQIKAQFPDFDAVVSKANIEELRRAHPTIAQALATALQNDPYNAAASTYTIIKEMGIDKVSHETNTTRRIIHENATKPRSAQAASPQRGSTPLSQANEYMYDPSGRATPEYQDQLVREMNDARKKLR